MNYVDKIEEEYWKPVVGYEGWYSVSKNGLIRRDINGKSTHVGRILKPVVSKTSKYPRVKLHRRGICKRVMVHLLVAEAFIGHNHNNYEVNHKDGVKTNNTLSNLEYVTMLENRRHAWKNGLYNNNYKRNLRKEKYALAPKTTRNV